MKSILLLAVFAFASPIVVLQSTSNMDIGGTVLRSDTSAPVEGVSIQITSSLTAGGTGTTASTDRNGHFLISNLAPGTYRVTARKDGYFGLGLNRLTGADVYVDNVAASVSLTSQSQDIRLTLVPGGELAGHVRDAAGMPVARSFPQLLEMVEGQPPRPVINQAQQTDDAGTYRFFGIHPGKYYLGVRVPAIGEVYYPGTLDLSKALLLEAKAGSEVSVDIQLPSAGHSVISGKVVSPPGMDPPTARLQMILAPRNLQALPNAMASTSPNFARNVTSEFEIRDVIPGSYDVFALSPAPQSLLFGPVRVEAKGTDIVGLVLPFHPSVEIQGRVVGDGVTVPTKIGNVMRIRLETVETPAPAVMLLGAMLNDDGSFTFPKVPLGEYHVNVCCGRYTFEIRNTTEPSGKETLTVDGAKTSPVEVVVHLMPTAIGPRGARQ